MKNIAKFIDHTNLAQDATFDDIKRLCQEAMEYGFFSVCVNSGYVSFAKELVKASNVRVCSVVGFPLGAMSTEAKIFETQKAIKDGADEIDMVINVGWLKSGRADLVKEDIAYLREASKERVLKVILETALLTEKEIRDICEISKEIGVDFVKTSTGFSKRGASIDDIEIMKKVVKDKVGIKASGGIRDYQKTLKMIKAGATRIGASSGIAIVKGFKAEGGC